MEENQTQIPEIDTRPEYKKKRVFVPLIVIAVFIVCAIFFSIRSSIYKSTDDAFVEGHVVNVAPRVNGIVTKLNIEDNMEVKKGDLLLEIDPNDYIVKLKQSQSKLNETKLSLINAKSEVQKKDIELKFAKEDFSRYSLMFSKKIASKQDYDKAKTKFESAKEDKIMASAKYEELKASIKRLEALVEQDSLNLSYTKIYASQDGLITNRTVEEGNYVQIAQNMFAIVPKEVWIVANFKETQIKNMKKGQPVKIKIDAYGSKRFIGELDSIQKLTGAKSSLFPPENAVGSYVKIVQRVPVKIIFKEDITKYNIIPGMSVVPEVKVK